MSSERRRKQIAALPWRRRGGRLEVLLVTSRERQRWIVPKGWPMEDKDDSDAAIIEAFEEAGVLGRIRRKPIAYFDYEKEGPVGHFKAVRAIVYALEVDSLLHKWPEQSERKRRWFTPAKAARLVVEPDLKHLFLALAEL